ncbi:hypothetical protein RF679_11520 [Undibacterium cyanobacteriorum]|uniref:Lipoprotein n=1 Tax=Undibacterium cyanobacteriorum TaxID=3073561 RepID=A0ABY9RDI1_9BURK|nr:hypothetical protein [Undibacterium sp. 20NA77.5]WMW79277.1 hypothetical protein RF679_11520 [Undibacterium sp. 20NA77.5]
MLKKTVSISSILAVVASLSACIAVSEGGGDSSKQIAIMSQQAISTCGAGNVDKVSTSSFTCKDRIIRPQN